MQMSVYEDSSGTKKVPAAPSDDENMVERDVEVLCEKTDVHEDTSETKKVEDEVEPIIENMNHEDTSPRSVEQVHNLDDDNCVKAEAAAMCFDVSTRAKNTDENTGVSVEDNLDEVRSFSFEDSDGTPVQVLPTDPSNEVETSDLGHHEMVVTGGDTTSGVKFESSQKVNVSPVSEKMIGSSTKLTNNSVTPKDIAFFDVEKNMQIGVDEEHVDHSEVKKFDDNANVTVENMQIGFFDVQENMQIDVDEEHVDHSELKKIDENTVTVEGILNEVHSTSFEDSDGTPVQVHPMLIDSSLIKCCSLPSSAGHVDACEVKSSFSQKMSRGGEDSKMKLTPAVEEDVRMSVNKEHIEDYLELHYTTPSEGLNILEQFGNYMMMGRRVEMSSEYTDVYQGSIMENLLYVSPMESSGYSAVTTCRDLDAHKMVVTGTAGGNADAWEVKSASSQMMSRGREDSKIKSAPESDDDVGSFYAGEENMQMSVREDFSGTKEVPAAPSEDENMVEREVKVLSETKKVEDEAEQIDQISIHQGASMENVNHEDTSARLVEQVQNCVKVEAAAMCFDASTGAKNTYENTDVAFKEILDEVRLSSFEDSDETPVQFLPTEQSTEVETSDFDVHEMVVTGTATKNASKSGVKFESSEKMIGSSTKLQHNSMTPRDIGFCDGEENMLIGVDEKEIGHSQVKKIDENTNVTVEDTLNEVHSSSFEDSDGTQVQVLPTDPSNEVETSDLNVRKMVVTDILPRKLARENICTFDMKDNFKTDKKEEVGSTISKYECAKRQPLQDLQQN